jgi:hypothetical protein
MSDQVCVLCEAAPAVQEDRCEPCLEGLRWDYQESRVF